MINTVLDKDTAKKVLNGYLKLTDKEVIRIIGRYVDTLSDKAELTEEEHNELMLVEKVILDEVKKSRLDDEQDLLFDRDLVREALAELDKAE